MIHDGSHLVVLKITRFYVVKSAMSGGEKGLARVLPGASPCRCRSCRNVENDVELRASARSMDQETDGYYR